MAGKSSCPFPNCDWRFNEFPNPAAHALYATCVELMALPTAGQIVGAALLDIILVRLANIWLLLITVETITHSVKYKHFKSFSGGTTEGEGTYINCWADES